MTTTSIFTPTAPPTVLWNKLRIINPIHWALYVRMSDAEDRTALGKLLLGMKAFTAGTPLTAALADLPRAIAEDTMEGEEARQTHGLIEIYLSDLDAHSTDQLVAYVGVVQGVLVMLCPSSAIKADLPPILVGATTYQRNAATELLLQALQNLPLQGLAIPKLNRTYRNNAFGASVLENLRVAGILLYTDRGKKDLRDRAAMAQAVMEGSTEGEGAALALKETILAGRINGLMVHGDGYSGRDFAFYACPAGYGPVWATGPGGVTSPVKGSIVVCPEWQPWIKALWTAYADGMTVTDIGRLPALQTLPLRNGTGRTLGDLPSRNAAQVLRSILTPRNAELHQTGRWLQYRSTSAALTTAQGIELTQDAKQRHGRAIEGRLPQPEFDGLPWGIAAEVWLKVAARMAEPISTAAQRGGMRAAGLVLTTSAVFTHHGKAARLVREHGSLQLRVMAEGSPWQQESSELLAASNGVLAVNALGRSLLSALDDAVHGRIVVDVPAGSETSQIRQLRDHLTQARHHKSALEQQVALLKQDASEAQTSGLHRVRQDALQAQELALTAIDAATADIVLAEWRLTAAETATPMEHADLRQPLVVAEAMIRWTGEPNEALTAAVKALRLPKTLTAERDPLTGLLQVSARAYLSTTEGLRIELPLSCTWPDTSRERDLSDGLDDLVRSWAQGATVAELAGSRGSTEAVITRRVRRWLGDRGVTLALTALMRCPVAIVRQAVCSTLEPELVAAPEAMNAATIAHLRAAYLDGDVSWRSWLGGATTSDQRLLDALLIAGGRADVAVLTATGCDAYTAQKPFGRRPALLATAGEALRALRRCPHAGCDGWASHSLYSPETREHAVVCPTCRRLPDPALAEVVLPIEFLQQWILTNSGSDPTLAEVATFDQDQRALLTDGLVRIKEVRKLMGLGFSGLWNLRQRGDLPEPRMVSGIEMWTLPEIQALVDQRAACRPGIRDGDLSPAKAAVILRVTEERVRHYCQEGLLAARRTAGTTAPRLRIKPNVLAQFTPLEGDLLSSLIAQEVATRTGIATWRVREALASGELVAAASTYVHARVTPAEADRWAATVRTR